MENMLFETDNFKVVAHPEPLVDRDEGGHIKIVTTKGVKDRLDLSPQIALELAWLTSLVGEAFKNTMTKQGIKIIKLNYQDMGNWAFRPNAKSPEHLHIHIFGRVFDAKHQPLPASVYLPFRETGFYDGFKPLTLQDEEMLSNEIKSLSKTEKYKKSNWCVK